MPFIRVETDEETRWINSDAIARATLAKPASSRHEILALYFVSSAEECTLKIDGSSPKNRDAIKALTSALDLLADKQRNRAVGDTGFEPVTSAV